MKSRKNCFCRRKTDRIRNVTRTFRRRRFRQKRRNQGFLEHSNATSVYSETLRIRATPYRPRQTLSTTDFTHNDDRLISSNQRDSRLACFVKKRRHFPALYESELHKAIEACVRLQEELGLDVLVHGEFERNDMVEYFGELLEGFAFSENGWVQSYGSRCVKPPLLHGSVSRKAPMTLSWITYAQSLSPINR